MADVKIIDTTSENISQFGMCGYKNLKNVGYLKKLDWTKERFNEGMKYKILFSEKDGAVGGIEYIPSEYAWRPVIADNYMFIHCIYIMKKEYKSVGYGQLLLDECISDAKKKKMNGVITITRKGTWMPSNDLFNKNGFEIVEKSEDGFELNVLTFKKTKSAPYFVKDKKSQLAKYKSGLYILTSQQCPYVDKAVTEITDVAKESYNLAPNIVDLKTSSEAKLNPSTFGVFSIVYNGEVVADHPISKRRFMNIMDKINSE